VTASTKGSTLSHGEHPSVTLVRRGVEAFRRGEAAWIWQHVVDDIIWHVGGTTPLSGTYRGMDEVLDFMKREREAMVAVNAEMEIGDVLANDDHVVLLGTMSADLPDGRRTRSKYVQVFHVSDEKVHQVWEVEMSRMVEL
jgi:ketosteroid isomerase-like protein